MGTCKIVVVKFRKSKGPQGMWHWVEST